MRCCSARLTSAGSTYMKTRARPQVHFSCGVYGVHPYVLMNFAGTLEDAFTLAHELGHNMHSYFSDHAQDFANHDYRIFVAEVASTVNEVLLTKYLLKTEQDPRRRAYILNHFGRVPHDRVPSNPVC